MNYSKSILKFIIKSCWIFTTGVLLTSQAFSQTTGKIKGYITDKYNNSPIALANIFVEGTPLGTSSKLDGSFSISRVPIGKQKIIVSAVGYAQVSQDVFVQSDKDNIVYIQMEEALVTSPEITVRADRPISTASSRMIQSLDFELRPRLSSQDLLRLVPGLFIAQHAGGGKAEQIFLRGFDSDHGTDINISVDGIPVNMVSHAHGQGYADLHFVIPEILRNIEVYKGPYFVQSGNFGTAGMVEFNTLDEIDHNSINIEGGSFGMARAVGIARIPLKSEMTSAYVAGEFLHNDSYFEHKQNLRRYNLFGKMKMHFDLNNALTIWASGFRSNWDASGQIPERAVEQNIISRFGAIDPTEGGETHRYNINLMYTNTNVHSHLLAQLYASRYYFQLFSNFTFYKNDPVNGDQIEQYDNRTILGSRIEYRMSPTFGNPKIITLIGSTLRTDVISNQLWHTVKRVRLKNSVNTDIHETNLAFYIQQDYLISPYIKLQLGLRNDNFFFKVKDKLNAGTPDDITNTVRQNILSPKANLTFSPSSFLDIFLNFGTGLHSNDARGVLAQRTEKTLPRAIGTELGTRYTPSTKLTTSVALWGLDLEREFVYVGDEGTTEERGATRRIGIDLDLRVQLLDWLWSDIDLTFSRGRFKDLPEGENYIPLAPSFSSTGGLTAHHHSGLEGSLRYRYIGERPANEQNTVRAKGYTVIDAGLAYRLQRYKLSLIVENLFNTKWNEAQFDTESQLLGESQPVSELHFTPGTPTSIRAKIEIAF